MTKVLVAYASRTGSCVGIAEVVAQVLRGSGLQVTAAPCSSVATVHGYDAVLVGSEVHGQRWLHEAVVFLDRHGHELALRPTWLFQCGHSEPDGTRRGCAPPRRVIRLVNRFGLRPPLTFAGRVDPRLTHHGSLEPPAGLGADGRELTDAVRAWAQWCARALLAGSAPGSSAELVAAGRSPAR